VSEPPRTRLPFRPAPYLLLAGIAALALTGSQDPPPDPLLAALSRLASGVDPAGAGKAIALGMQAWVFASVAIIAGFLAWYALEAFRGKSAHGRKRSFRQRMRDPRFALVAWFAALGLVAGGLYAIRSGAEAVEERLTAEATAPALGGDTPLELGLEPEPEQPETTAGELYASTPDWVRYAVATLLGGIACGFAVAALSAAVRRRQPLPAPAATEATILAEGMARAVERIHLADDLRDAIISAYADMCSLFAAPGDSRPRSLTPREFARRLRADGAAEDRIDALTALFEKARYSAEPCGTGDREAAVECLSALAGLYRRKDGR